MALHKNPSSSSTHSIVTDRHLSSAACHEENQQNVVKRESAEQPAVWNPTREQTELLQSLYCNEGIRNPSVWEINEIVDRLKQFGDVEGKNVFNWFQNFKVCTKQGQKRQLSHFHDMTPPPHSAETSIPALPSDRSRFRCEYQTNGVPKMRGSVAPVQHKMANMETIDFPRKTLRVTEPIETEINTSFRDQECAPRDSHISFGKVDGEPNRAGNCTGQNRLRRQFRRTARISVCHSNFNSRKAGVHPPSERIIPRTLPLFPLQPEGLGVKERSDGTFSEV